MIPFSQFCLAMKLAAAGPVSQEDATAALQRYKKLEDAAPTVKQVGRYAGIGAVAAPVATVLKDTISGGKPILGGSGNRLRTLAGNAVAGALTSGGIPLVRAHLDREAEKNTLRKYIAQSAPPKVASVPAATGLRRVGQVFSGSRVKALTEDSAAAVRKGSDAFKESERKGTRANELIRWAEEMEPLTMEPQRHARANARLYREEAQRHAAEGAEHVARGAALKREAKGERLKQVGAIGGTAAAAATGAAIGAKKLLSRKDTEKEKTSAMSGVTPAKPWAANEYADMGKMGAGASTRGGFLMASEVAPWRQPKLHTAIQHEPQQIVEKMGAARAEWLQKRAGATTPAGRLASSHRVGLPKVSAPPGPSIADTVPTFGQRLPGANKTTIGKRSIRETPTLANTAPPQG